MRNDRHTEATPILGIGIATLALLAAVATLAWALGLDEFTTGVMDPAADGGETFTELTLRDGSDTARATVVGRLAPGVDESSGVAVSRTHPGVLWTHNDGADARLHAIRQDGTVVATVRVTGFQPVDWEDIDLGSCPGDGPRERDCLYIGDIGDNTARRRDVGVVIVPEPDPATESSVTALRRVGFRYADGPADAEAVALAAGGVLLVITKGNDGTSRVYRVPTSPTEERSSIRTVAAVATLPLEVAADRDRVTGAAVSPDGTRLAVRNHHAVFLFPVDELTSRPVACEVGIEEPQGEAVDFLSADTLILTSEEGGGRSPIVRLHCS